MCHPNVLEASRGRGPATLASGEGRRVERDGRNARTSGIGGGMGGLGMTEPDVSPKRFGGVQRARTGHPGLWGGETRGEGREECADFGDWGGNGGAGDD